MPSYRLEDILGRSGFRIHRSTQWRWMRAIGEAALPLVELMRRLAHAIDRLPWRLRVALTLRVFEGLDYADIARTSGVTETTARTHVMKARRLLARWLGPLIEEDE